jgi:hypothetical protein
MTEVLSFLDEDDGSDYAIEPPSSTKGRIIASAGGILRRANRSKEDDGSCINCRYGFWTLSSYY